MQSLGAAFLDFLDVVSADGLDALRSPRSLGLGRGRRRVVFRRVLRRLFGDQHLPVGDGYLIIIGVDFVEREEALAIAAIVHKRRLQGWFDPDDLGEVYVSFELFAGCYLDIKFFQPFSVEHHHPSFLRVSGVD